MLRAVLIAAYFEGASAYNKQSDARFFLSFFRKAQASSSLFHATHSQELSDSQRLNTGEFHDIRVN
jgi:hypothetical protein